MKFRGIIALTLSLTVLLTACAQVAPAETTEAEMQALQGQLAAPNYPKMAPYPDEMAYVNESTGEFDDKGFNKVYTAWREGWQSQYSQPQGYAQGLDTFFRESISEFLEGDATENSVCSPLNLYMAMALLAEVTDGQTRQQVLAALNAESVEALRTQAGHVWNAHYCADGASACVLANSLWMDQAFTYNQDTVNRLAESYYASAFQGDLGSQEMDAMLQAWINHQTDGLLEEQAGNIHMDPQTVLALASTIYYRAKWTSEFSENQNTQGQFYSPAGEVEATYMNTTLSFGPYYWGEDFGAVALDLEDGSRMWLVLPDEGVTPAQVLDSGHALDLILGDPYSYENQKSLMVHLSVPKFDVTADRKVNDALEKLGIADAFDPEKADFSAIVTGEACWLDSVDHAARVAIDETGVTAAAYTVMLMCGAGMPPAEQTDFVLDRPFLFVIASRDNLPLFAGIVNQP
jgi:serine protease inhibitor